MLNPKTQDFELGSLLVTQFCGYLSGNDAYGRLFDRSLFRHETDCATKGAPNDISRISQYYLYKQVDD